MNHSKNREISHLGSGFMNLKPLEQCITPLTFFKHILEILSFAERMKILPDYNLPISFQTQWHVQQRECHPNTIRFSRPYYGRHIMAELDCAINTGSK